MSEFITIDLGPKEYLEFLDYLEHKLVLKADELEEDAGLAGARDDGGATMLRYHSSLYKAALDKKIPQCWSTYLVDFKNVIDPEYEEYLRLKNKFA